MPIPDNNLREWMGKVERDLDKLETKWTSSVDDIKNTIKSEIADLKAEQIADLRQAIRDREKQVNAVEVRLREVEEGLNGFIAGSGLLTHILRMAIGIAGVIAGYLGAKHLG